MKFSRYEFVRYETWAKWPQFITVVSCALLLQTLSAPACVLSLLVFADLFLLRYTSFLNILNQVYRFSVCLFFRSEEEGHRGWRRLHFINPGTKYMWLSWNVPQSSDNPEHQIQIRKNQGAHPGIWGILRGLVTKGAFCWTRGKWCNATDGLNDFAWLQI